MADRQSTNDIRALLEKRFLEMPKEFSIDILIENMPDKGNIAEKLKEKIFFETIAQLALNAYRKEMLGEYTHEKIYMIHPSLRDMITNITELEGRYVKVDKEDYMRFKYFGDKSNRVYLVSFDPESKNVTVQGVCIREDRKYRFTVKGAYMKEKQFALRTLPPGSNEEKIVLFNIS